MKRRLTLILAISLIATLFAGCGGNTPASSAPANDASQAAASEAPNPVETAEPEGSAESAVEATVPTVTYTVDYPLTETPVTFDCFASVPSNVSNFISDSLSDFPAYQIAEEQTGIHLDWTLTNPENEMTKLNLVIASGEYPTFFKAMDSLYPTGRDASVEDEVVLDLSEMLEEYAPDYYAFCQENNIMKLLSTDMGYITAVTPLATDKTEGAQIRADWLRELDLEVPTTIDELNKVLMTFKEKKGANNAVILNSLFVSYAECFDFSMRGFAGGLEFNYIDGEIVPYFENENFFPYLDTLKYWIENGLCADYLTITNPGLYENIILNDNAGFWFSGTTTMADSFYEKYLNGTIDVDAIPTPVYEEGAALHVNGRSTSLNVENGWSISKTCDDPEMALGFLNWFYTEEGNIAASFGREGEGLAWDENGEPTFSDLVMNNPDGYPVMLGTILFAGYGTPVNNHPNVQKCVDSANNEEQNAAADIWYTNKTTEYEVEGNLTAEESEIVASLSGDIGTMFEEFMAKYINGETDKAEYDALLEQAKGMGLDELIQVKKAAHERYLAR